jgi:hypothetical protein
MNRPGDRSAEARIREWLAAAPEHGPERALEDTIDRLRATDQPRTIVLRLSMPIAAALTADAVVVGGAGLWIGTRPESPTPTPSAATSASCSLEIAVGGRSPIVLGRGFAPDTDVVLDVDLANGSHDTVTVEHRPDLHTDSAGRFGFPMLAHPDNVGRNVLTASAGGCTAAVEMVVTADQLPAPCPDQSTDPITLMDRPAYRTAVERDRPAHWWHFDEVAGPTGADSAGAADGRWIGDPTPVGDGTDSRAVFLNGVATYIEIPELALGDFTIEAWVYLCDEVDNQDALLGNHLQAPSVNFFDQHLRLFTGGEDVVIADTAVTLGEWQHWALTRDATGTRIYLNGALDATGPAWQDEMVINQIGRGDAGYLRGAIDELAIFDRALTSEELTAHAEAR